jgi:hypothetical protein
MTHDWGRRLSDRIRAALAAGDLGGARRLAAEGDGHARSLEREYALMYRGLGITLRVLLGLLPDTLRRLSRPEPAREAAVALLRRFRGEMREAMLRAWGEPAVREALGAPAAPAAGPPLEQETAAAARLLEAGETLFAREQARLAREVVAAIDAGDAATARRLVDVKERDQYVPLHDRMIRFMADTFAWVLLHGGPGELLRFHLATAEGQRQGFEKWERMPAEEFARATAFLLRQHMGEVEVREDAEKFTVEQRPCGSGGRLRVAGAYTGPGALPFVEEPGALTLGEPRMPVYCSHCPVWNGLAPIQWFGRPHWVFDRPARADGSCTLHVYKRRDGAPAGYARRLGRGGAG